MRNISTTVRGHYDDDRYMWAIIIRRFCDKTLVNRAIVVDNKRKEVDAKRKRLQGQASGSNTRQRIGF
jgi:hypothetical protein